MLSRRRGYPLQPGQRGGQLHQFQMSLGLLGGREWPRRGRPNSEGGWKAGCSSSGERARGEGMRSNICQRWLQRLSARSLNCRDCRFT
eukprot:6522304-Alexandrium_andersonii.AAC.1